MSKRVLILGGSGRTGRYSTRAFGEAGWDVRQFNRQTDDMAHAAQGCDVIINGLNPQNYHDWPTILPRITRDVIKAARSSGATVIVPGNVYHFGDQGGVWSQTTPAKPVSRKGQIRLEIEQAYQASGVQTIILRAGNFIDPEDRNCVMSLIYLRGIKGGAITLPGRAAVRQAFCHVADWARAAVALAEMRDELAEFEDVPIHGQTFTGNQIKELAENIIGKRLKFSHFPWWMMSLASPFWELAREMKEMRYLYETDHTLCERRLAELLPDFRATPKEDVMRAMLA